MKPMIDPSFLDQMEHAFGQDLSVVVFAESELPAWMGAAAVAARDFVLFAPGVCETDSAAGRHLIAHELAHVVQQRCGMVEAAGPVGLLWDRDLERHADECARRAVRGRRVAALPGLRRGPSRPVLQPALVIDSDDANYINTAQAALDRLLGNTHNALTYTPEGYYSSWVGRTLVQVTAGPNFVTALGLKPRSATLVQRVINSDHWTRIVQAHQNDASPDKWLKDTAWSAVRGLFADPNRGFMQKVMTTGSSTMIRWSGLQNQTANLSIAGMIRMETVDAFILLAHELIHADRIGRGLYRPMASNATFLVDQRQKVDPLNLLVPTHFKQQNGVLSALVGGGGANLTLPNATVVTNAGNVITSQQRGRVWVSGTMESIEEIATVGLSDDANAAPPDPLAITENMIRAEHQVHKRLKYGAFNQVLQV